MKLLENNEKKDIYSKCGGYCCKIGGGCGFSLEDFTGEITDNKDFGR